MDSTTAPQSFASSLGEGPAASHAGLFELAARLTDPSDRAEIARALAARAGAEDLIIFVLDAEVGVLLPAPGFRQTLPDSQRWRAFLSGLAEGVPQLGRLPYPDRQTEQAALGLLAPGGSVLVLLGGQPIPAVAQTLGIVMPILAAAFRGEQALLAAKGHAAVAREGAGQAKLLAASLEKARQALQSALAQAERANSAKDQFLAVLSHELRTPLGPVLTTATALLADPALPPHLREPLEVIRRNADLEARLIDDLLDLTRVARGKMPLSFSTVDAHTSVRHTVEICRSDIYRKKLQLALNLDAAEHHVRADPARLQQVLWNLVKNAVKFTPAGGSLEIRSSNERGQIRIDVSDTGMGIEPAFLDKIFKAFEQTSDTVTHRFGGLGLGLAISKALVEAQEGTLVASSAGKGKGATFSLQLAVVPRPRQLPQTKASSPAGKRRGSLKLLLVEDHRDTAAVMSRLLRGLGHEVATADSIARSLQVAGEHTFDLVLSDLGLPDGSGLDLMRQLRERFGLPGIAISGYGMEDDLRQTREAGFIAHLTKPVSFNQVQAVLAQFAAARTVEGNATG
ncbi:MAG: domain S-box [Phycisphaerales bacterium]|nr:domain S-box [Phycisphaerales bacterium]